MWGPQTTKSRGFLEKDSTSPDLRSVKEEDGPVVRPEICRECSREEVSQETQNPSKSLGQTNQLIKIQVGMLGG